MKINIDLEDWEVKRLVSDYQKVVRLQKSSGYEMFSIICDLIEDMFPISEWILGDGNCPAEYSDYFLDYVMTADLDELVKVMLSTKWEKKVE